MNRALLALLSFALGGTVVWVTRPRGDGRELAPARTTVPDPTPQPAPVPTPAPVWEPTDPDDIEALGDSDLPAGMKFVFPGSLPGDLPGSSKTHLDELIEKMNWCGTGRVGGEYVPPPPPARRAPFGVDAHGDNALRRLLAELEGARLPSQHRRLIRAFLVERAMTASPTEFEAIVRTLARGEPFPVIRVRLMLAAQALLMHESWEKAFDEYRWAVRVQLPPPPKDR